MVPPEHEQREEQQGEAAVYAGINATNTQSVDNTQGKGHLFAPNFNFCCIHLLLEY